MVSMTKIKIPQDYNNKKNSLIILTQANKDKQKRYKRADFFQCKFEKQPMILHKNTYAENEWIHYLNHSFD